MSNSNQTIQSNQPNDHVLLATPVRDRSWVLPHYLSHLYEIDYPKKLISILWVINQSTDDSEKILREFKQFHEHEYNKITIKRYNGTQTVPQDKRTNEIRQKYSYNHLSELRNFILSQVHDNDYIFSLDSDILVRSDCLAKLVSHNKDIISSIIYNGYKITDKENAWRYPNVLRRLANGKIEHIANSYIKKSPIATESKLLKVSITGAIYLISNKVAKQVKYGYHNQGEDIAFCLDAESKGFEIWTDVGIFSEHIMDKDMLEDYLTNT